MIAVWHAAAVVAAFTALFAWLFALPVVTGGYLAESDLYEYFLPVFLSQPTVWSSFEFGGMPAFADPGEPTLSPVYLLARGVLGSWTAYVALAYVVAACGAYAYVYTLTGSRLAAAGAGLVYALSEAMVERLAHLGTVQTIAWFPLMALAIDGLRRGPLLPWMAVGALVFASGFLGGNPQTFLYGGYALAVYALVGGVVERAPLRYYLAGTAMVALAGLMTAGKSLPMLEASLYTSRQTVNFGQFVSHSNTPPQMLSLVFPAVAHEGREAPTYVGLAALLFAAVAARHPGHNWRVAFWVVTGAAALATGLGDATPLAQLLYDVPFYDKFRIVGRHLYLAAFAAAALLGFGIAAVQRGEVSRRVVAVATVGLVIALGSAAVLLAVYPGHFALEPSDGLPWDLPLWPRQIWGQIVMASLLVASVLAFARRPRHPIAVTALLVAMGADLMLATSYRVGPAGFRHEILPAAATQPSVHASRIREQLAPNQQRLLAPGGTHLDPVAPAVFARAWSLPIAGGYGPMLLAAHQQLAMMERNGAVQPTLLADSNRALDVLATRLVVIRMVDFDAGEAVTFHDTPWSATSVALPIGAPECGHRLPRSASYAVPQDMTVTAVAIAARLRCSEDVPQGQQVATITIAGADATASFPLRAGIEIAEEELNDSGIRRRARHEPAQVLDPEAPSPSYVARFDLPRPTRGVRLDFELAGTGGSMELDRVTVRDAAGVWRPLSAMSLLVSDPRRWRTAAQFATSRLTDRGRDESVEGEQPYVVLENLRARPRAWLVEEVVPLEPRAREIALHYGQLPDGRAFDPARAAIVEPGIAAARFETGRAAVRVRRIDDGRVDASVESEGGGFLVLSEASYPGWRVLIDGVPAKLHVANGALQGVVVPPGAHRLEFSFSSATRIIGLGISGAALAIVGALLLSAGVLSPRRASRAQHPAAV